LICTTATAVLAAGAQVLTLIAGAVTIGTPQAASTFNVATSADRQLATAPATVALGGQLTGGSAIVFSASADTVPGATSTGTVKIGFTTATAVPIGGSITIALPKGYFSATDNSKVNTFTTDGSASAATAKCASPLNLGTDGTSVLGISNAQTLICTISLGTGILNAGVQVFTLAVGAVTPATSAFGPQAVASYNVATSTDRQLATAPATVALGGRLTAGTAIQFDATTGAVDKVPGTLSTGPVKIGFTTATAIPIAGTITIALPAGYFSATDATKDNTVKTAGAGATTAKCVHTPAVATTAVLGMMGAEKLVCTTAGAILAAGVQELTFLTGAVTTGTPQAAATYQVATSQDLQLATAPATVALGGRLTAGTALVFGASNDRAEGTLNTGAVTIGFTSATAIPIVTAPVFKVPSAL